MMKKRWRNKNRKKENYERKDERNMVVESR